MRSALLLFALAVSASALDVRVLDMDEQVTTGTAITVDGDDLVVTLADGGSKRIPCDSVVEITFPANDGAPATNPMVEVVLSNGDVIRGDVTGGDSGSITLSAGEMGSVDVDLTRVSRVLVLIDNNREKIPSDAAAEDVDRLYLANQDTDVGFPPDEGDPITAEGITINSERSKKLVTYPWKDIAGWFVAASQPVEPTKELIATVVCSGGTRLTGKVSAVTGQTLTLDHVVVKTIPVPVAAVRAIYFVNGRVTYLSDLDPTGVRERPFIYDPERPDSSSYPYRRDGAVEKGEPLTIKTREFRKGLGVHAFSALEYATRGQFARFCATVGLDRTAVGADGAGGSVVFQVFAGTLDQVGPELRLYPSHVEDWKDLCSRLKESKPFGATFDENGQKAIEEVASGEEATDARKAAICGAVNAALTKADLYQEKAFPADSLPEDAQAILKKGAAKRTPREIDRLHRRCLESVAGDSIAAVPAPPRLLYDSGLVRYGEEPKDVSVSLQDVETIVLVVRCGVEGDIFDGETHDRADWGGARFIR